MALRVNLIRLGQDLLSYTVKTLTAQNILNPFDEDGAAICLFCDGDARPDQ